MSEPTVHPGWTDADLDAALTGLGAELDRSAGTVAPDPLAALRARLVTAAPAAVDRSTPAADTSAPGVDRSAPAAVHEVIELGPTRATRERDRRSRLVPALLLAAVLVAGVSAAIVFRPTGGDRSAPPARPAATPSPSTSGEIVAARQSLLLQPVVDGAVSVLVSVAGVGDTTVPFPPLTEAEEGGRANILSYGFTCGDPRFGGDPNGPDNDVSQFRLLDDQGIEGEGSCVPLADGVAVASFGTSPELTPAGRSYVRVDVPSPDTVWKLAVVVTRH